MAVKDIDKVFKALADPSRRRLIDRLHKRGGQTLNELCEGLDMARQSVTQHLGLLEEANLISVEWRGREKRHYFNPVPIHEIYVRWIRKFEEQRLAALHEFKTKLERK
ncbi:MAG TPA: helix-turn-helix domain-containing protein [Burkholderiaceae bacterium]|nr:helix-turn-helix domain-containing protein [Burkholderiaceae bacterium]